MGGICIYRALNRFSDLVCQHKDLSTKIKGSNQFKDCHWVFKNDSLTKKEGRQKHINGEDVVDVTDKKISYFSYLISVYRSLCNLYYRSG